MHSSHDLPGSHLGAAGSASDGVAQRREKEPEAACCVDTGEGRRDSGQARPSHRGTL